MVKFLSVTFGSVFLVQEFSLILGAGGALLPFSGLSFHFVDSFLCSAEAFSLMDSSSSFLFPLPGDTYQKKILLREKSEITAYVFLEFHGSESYI